MEIQQLGKELKEDAKSLNYSKRTCKSSHNRKNQAEITPSHRYVTAVKSSRSSLVPGESKKLSSGSFLKVLKIKKLRGKMLCIGSCC